MPNRRFPPAYYRYLKARLLNFTRPAFWGTAIFLSITGLAIREFWANPDLLTGRNSQNQVTANSNSRLTPEERAIAADIDNLPVLFFDFEQAVLPTLNAAKVQANQKNKSLSQQAIEGKNQDKKTQTIASESSNKTPSVTINNPFLKQAENLLKIDSISTSPWISNPQGMTNESNRNLQNTIVNPLQAELNPSAYPNYSSVTGKTTNPTPLELAINQSRTTNRSNLNLTSFQQLPNQLSSQTTELASYPNNSPNYQAAIANSNTNNTNYSSYSQTVNNSNFNYGTNPVVNSTTIQNQNQTSASLTNYGYTSVNNSPVNNYQTNSATTLVTNQNYSPSNQLNTTNTTINTPYPPSYSPVPVQQPTTNYAPIMTGR